MKALSDFVSSRIEGSTSPDIRNAGIALSLANAILRGSVGDIVKVAYQLLVYHDSKY